MGRSPSCDENGVKKGPWTPEEDQKLMDYITRNGHGSWRALPKLAGLNRCGKSCRLRWTNYLRPDIKRGNFSDDEQKLIINLHAVLGNKWSTIAGHLPGRTDNEIKNLWNTHLKKKLVHMGIDPVTHRPRTDLNNVLSNLPHLIAAANFATTFLSTRAPASWPDVMSAAAALRSLPCSYPDATQQAKIQALILQLLGSNNNGPCCGIPATTNTNTSYSSMEADIYSLLGLASCSSSSLVPEHHQCDVDDYLRAIEESCGRQLESAAGFTTPPQHHILHSSTRTATTCFPDTHHHRLPTSTAAAAATTSAGNVVQPQPDVSMIINNMPTHCYQQLPQLVVPNSPTSSPALPHTHTHTSPDSPKPLSHYKITQTTKLNPVHNHDNITSNPNSSTNSTSFIPAACSWVDLVDDETTDSQYYWNHIME